MLFVTKEGGVFMEKLIHGGVTYTKNLDNQEIKRHEKYEQICIDSYDSDKMNKNYNVLKESDKKIWGFKGYAVQTGDNEICIIYRGTDFKKVDLYDFWNDYKMTKNKVPAQMTEALDFIQKIKFEYPRAKIVLSGHSLGGSLAQMIAMMVSVDEVVTFSPFGTLGIMAEHNEKYGIATPPELVTNYTNPKDPIGRSNLKYGYGNYYFVPELESTYNIHKVENWQSLEHRIPIDQTEFLSVREGLYNHTVGRAKTYADNIYNIFNPIYDKVKSTVSSDNNKSSADLNISKDECVGEYWVDGYKRADGTVVNGYWRHCGAAHQHKKEEILAKYKNKKAQDLTQDELNEVLPFLI